MVIDKIECSVLKKVENGFPVYFIGLNTTGSCQFIETFDRSYSFIFVNADDQIMFYDIPIFYMDDQVHDVMVYSVEEKYYEDKIHPIVCKKKND